jgi:ribosomal protein L12E/L44/L45/RPP1/RPP2
VIARKRAELTTTEIDTKKLEELIAAAPQQPDVKLGRATTRAVEEEAIMEIVAQQQQPTRVAPAPVGPPRLAHTKRRQPTEGESFDDPTTVHTRTTGAIPVERAAPVAIAVARGSSIDLPSAEDVSVAVSTIVTNDSITAPASVANKLADGSDAMIAVEAKPEVVDVDVVVESEAPVVTVPSPSPMRARAIALSGVLAAAVVAAAWWLAH